MCVFCELQCEGVIGPGQWGVVNEILLVCTHVRLGDSVPWLC